MNKLPIIIRKVFVRTGAGIDYVFPEFPLVKGHIRWKMFTFGGLSTVQGYVLLGFKRYDEYTYFQTGTLVVGRMYITANIDILLPSDYAPAVYLFNGAAGDSFVLWAVGELEDAVPAEPGGPTAY